jgi:hypothetical protein
MEVSTLEDPSETINPSAGRASREQRQLLRQQRVLRSLNDCYELAETRWEVVGLAGFGSFLDKPLAPQVPGFLSPSSQIQIPSWR